MTQTHAPTPQTVRDLMTPDPITVEQDEVLGHAAHLMEEYEVSGLPVVDDDGVLVGILSQTDLVHARSVDGPSHSWPDVSVRHYMAVPVITATPTMTVREAALLMEARHVHRLVVVDDEQRRPVGVLSMTDLVRQMAQDTPDA